MSIPIPPIPLGPPLSGFADGPDGPGIEGVNQFASGLQRGAGVQGNSRTFGVVGQLGGPGELGTSPVVPAGVWGQGGNFGDGVFGNSVDHDGVVGISEQREGVRGVSNSKDWAAVAGIQNGTGPGVWGSSQGGEGVHAESNAANWAACAAIHKSGGPGLWASGNPAGHFEGDVVVTGHVILLGRDLAEDFAIAGENVEPGTVMVIEHEDALRSSEQEYDKRVAGVVSGAGEFRPGIILGRQQARDDRVAIALMGRVLCKVDASTAAIEVGDLLTTSPTPGHAMKACDPLKGFGAVIGKALRSLESGRGMIPILITLH